VIGGRAAAAVRQLTAGVDALLQVPLELEPEAVPALLALVEVQRRRLEAVDQRLLAVVSRQGRAESVPALLCIDQREARARMARAVDLGPRQALTGEVLPPVLARTAAAVARGAVSAAQVDVIIGCVERIPASAPASAWPVAEQLLIEAARFEAPRELARTAQALLARLDPDGVEPVEDRIERQRAFSLVKHRDGSASPRGTWTAELSAYWEAILDSLAAPQPAGDQPDQRSASQRRHDAMLEVAQRVLRSGELPSTAGVPVTVLATTTIGELATAAGYPPDPRTGTGSGCSASAGRDPETGAGGLDPDGAVAGSGLDLDGLLGADSAALATLGHGQIVSARTLLAMACEAQVVPVVFNEAGGIMAYGATRRLASPGQRLALAARDGGCCFPGCDRPAAWSEVHHIVPWLIEQRTDIDNLCLLCPHHHRSFDKAGWQVHLEHGTPYWIPPPWIDHQRQPRRNTTHHRSHITFRQPSAA
jgi:Domain of unknown function (DUF222)/HNH endonuclease